MRYDISGTVMQTVSIDLDPGDVLISQTHAMAWMTDGVSMDTHTGGGLWAGLKRAMTGAACSSPNTAPTGAPRSRLRRAFRGRSSRCRSPPASR